MLFLWIVRHDAEVAIVLATKRQLALCVLPDGLPIVLLRLALVLLHGPPHYLLLLIETTIAHSDCTSKHFVVVEHLIALCLLVKPSDHLCIHHAILLVL